MPTFQSYKPQMAVDRILEGVSPVVRAHLVDAAGDDLTIAGVASIAWTSYDLSATGAPLASGSLVVAEVIYAELETERWTADADGFNFRTQVDGSAWEAGKTYRVEFVFTCSGYACALVCEWEIEPLYSV